MIHRKQSDADPTMANLITQSLLKCFQKNHCPSSNHYLPLLISCNDYELFQALLPLDIFLTKHWYPLLACQTNNPNFVSDVIKLYPDFTCENMKELNLCNNCNPDVFILIQDRLSDKEIKQLFNNTKNSNLFEYLWTTFSRTGLLNQASLYDQFSWRNSDQKFTKEQIQILKYVWSQIDKSQFQYHSKCLNIIQALKMNQLDEFASEIQSMVQHLIDLHEHVKKELKKN